MSRKNKSVSFNEDDPIDAALLKHAEKINPFTGKSQNFSKYVKRLIEEELKREQLSENVFAQKVTVYEEVVNFNEDEEELISSFL